MRYENIGSVVQLVRIHACHAWGRGFESRPDRFQKKANNKKALVHTESGLFCCL
jgi:putative component of membrane protein insertase Oxa1/YidC/SpoIIIJ protein YidD